MPPGRALNVANASAKCIEDLKLDKDTLQKYLARQLGDSDSTRKYIHCLGYESGYVTDDGHLIKNEVLEVVGNYRERIDGIVDECNKLKYDDKYETVYRVIMCFFEKSNLQFKV